MKRFFFILLLLPTINIAFGQETSIAGFAVWKPKEGQLQNFENGYKQHLNWHKTNNDKWGWHGWFITSGERYGQFVDATFNHTWADFDSAVKPGADIEDNRFHVFPFGEVQTFFKVAYYPKYSSVDTFANKLKLLKMITLDCNNIDQAFKVVDKLKDYYNSKQIKSFKTYKIVDGGLANRIILLLGFSNWAEYGMTENLIEKINEAESFLKLKSITSSKSETMVYRADMSWFPN
jgi:hypothetical protein